MTSVRHNQLYLIQVFDDKSNTLIKSMSARNLMSLEGRNDRICLMDGETFSKSRYVNLLYPFCDVQIHQ